MASVIQKQRGMRLGQHLDRTHCRKGHKLSSDNIMTSKRGHRKCKQCYRNKQARVRQNRQPLENAKRRQQTAERKRLIAHAQMERDHHYADWLRDGVRGSGHSVSDQ